MSPGILAFIVAISGGVWIYTKLQSHTGYGNSKNAAVGATVAGIIIFVVVFSLAHMLLSSSSN